MKFFSNIKFFSNKNVLLPSIIGVVLLSALFEWYILSNHKNALSVTPPAKAAQKTQVTPISNTELQEKLMLEFKKGNPNAKIKKHAYVDLNGNKFDELVVLYSVEKVENNQKSYQNFISVLAASNNFVKTVVNKEVAYDVNGSKIDFSVVKSPVSNKLKLVNVEYLGSYIGLIKVNKLVGFDGDETRVLFENTSVYPLNDPSNVAKLPSLVDLDNDGIDEFISYHNVKEAQPTLYWRNSFKWNNETKSFEKFKKELYENNQVLKEIDKSYIIDDTDFGVNINNNIINLSKHTHDIVDFLGNPKKVINEPPGYLNNPKTYVYNEANFFVNDDNIYGITLNKLTTNRGIKIGDSIDKVYSAYGEGVEKPEARNSKVLIYNIENSKIGGTELYLNFTIKNRRVSKIEIGEYLD